MLIGCAQAVEHYEIARYGLLKTWAKKLGMQDAETLLGETLEEEKRADQRLSEIAKSLTASGEDEDPESDEDEDGKNQDAETKSKSESKKN